MSTPTARDRAVQVVEQTMRSPGQGNMEAGVFWHEEVNAIERVILEAEARGRAEGVKLALKVLNDVRQGRGAMTEAGTVSLLAFHSIKEAAKAEGIEIGDET